MPFTPFHMGPGILIKALLQSSFSLMVFGWAQIVMDIQPLWVLITGNGHLHGFSHTFIGCALLAVVSAISGKYLSELGLRLLGIGKAQQPVVISWWVASLSAAVGCSSHVLLDGIMHADLQPYFPFSPNNDLLGVISIEHLHQFCVYSGLLGAVIFFLIQWRNRLRC